MATSLTPELLKQLQDYYKQSNSGYSPQGAQEFGGQMYQQNVNQGGYAAEGGDGGSSTPYGFTSYKPGATTGDAWQQFDTKGDFTREGILKEDPWLQNLLMAVGGAVGMSMIPVGMAGGSLGSAGALAGDAMMPGAMGAGGSAMSTAPLAGLEGYLAAGGATVPGTFNAAMDSQLANAAMGPEALSGYTSAGAGGVTASPIAGAGGGSSGGWMDKLTKLAGGAGGGGGSSLLGLAASGLGGLAGGQGQEDSSSQTRRMDPRLDQPVFGDLIPRTQSLLGQQMTPERMAGYRQMQTMGQSLLGRPVAGNDFERFYGGR